MGRSKAERLAEMMARLDAAPACGTREEAFGLVTSIVNRVEDELTDIPNDPSTPRADERIWPPIDMYHFEVPGRPDLDGYRQRGHETLIRSNGALLIRARRSGDVILDKPGRDGRKVAP